MVRTRRGRVGSFGARVGASLGPCAAALAWVLAVSACSSEGQRSSGGVAGAPTAAAGTAGSSSGGSTSAGNGGGPAGAAGAAQLCPELPPLLQPSGRRFSLTFAPVLGDKPLLLSEPNAVPGGQITPTNVRFFVSEVKLLAEGSAPVPVDLVTTAGSAEPYGVHLVNLEEPESMTLQLVAPAGAYTGLRFTFGVNDACNAGASGKDPLSANSQMSWPHFAGFLFFRYEALWTADAGAAAPASAPPSMIHMGGLIGSIFAPQATVTGAMSVPATGELSVVLRASFDEIFRGATGEGDLSGLPPAFQSSEVIAGEQLRQAVPQLPIFTLSAP